MWEGWSARSCVALLVAWASLTGCRNSAGPGSEPGLIKVVRVQNPSDERSGAEHCVKPSGPCQPLAPGQEIQRSGIVRTFAGAGVTLDLGHGRKLELGPLSEAKLSDRAAQLHRGEIGVSGTPLIAKEPPSAFDFMVGRRTFSLDSARGALAQLSVSGDTAELTMRRGRLRGADVDGLLAGHTVRLTSAGAFHTSASGGELAPLPYVGSQRRDFAELWPEAGEKQQRGLGTMTARVPNTDRVLGGMRLRQHHVEVTIVDGLARTEVVEEFENQTEQVLEGRFRFPIPSDASVSRLGLWVGDDLVEGEVVEAKRARSIYESIVDRPVPRDPALLEWVTAGEMSLTVFPVLPKKSRRVLLAYDQLLTIEGGRFRYSYPLSLGEGRENTIADLRIAVHVRDTQGEIGALRVPSHDVRVGREGVWSSVYFAEQNAAARRDFVVLAERSARGSAYVAADLPGWVEPRSPVLLPSPAAGTQSAPSPAEGHFLLRASVDLPSQAQRPEPLHADRALVLDVSYSQSQATVRAQAAFALAVLRELEPEEGLVLLACDSACSVHTSPAGPLEGRVEAARRFLGELAPGGSSDLAGALVAGSLELGRLSRANPGKGRQLVLLSDGQASAGELSAQGIARVASRYLTPEGVDLRLVGVGRKLDQDQLENLAVELDAALDQLPSAVDLEQRIFEVAIGLRQPVLRSARISLPAGFVLAQGSRLPALRLGQEVVLTGVLRGNPEGQVELSGRLQGADYRLVVPLAAPTADAARNPLVAGLYARQRIKQMLAAGEPPQAEIVRLSTAYRTMSPYTSFLVLENDEMFRRFGVERRSRASEDEPTFAFDPPSEPLAIDPEDAMSFEQERSEGKLDALASAPAAAPASPPPAPKAKKASSASGAAESTPGKSFDAYEKPSESRMLEDDLAGAYVKRRYARRPPRAHLSYSAADDAWRTWATAELERLRQALAGAPESRARMEEFVRRHLAQGRFLDAAGVARRFFELDPDYLLAQDLLAQASVVAGDHEFARRMLDVQVETSPRSAALHTQAARAFASAGDSVRACAHLRSLAELSPTDTDAGQRASSCFLLLLGGPVVAQEEKPKTSVPQLRVSVECAPGTAVADCPAPVLVAPDGRVTSPWTPGSAEAGSTSVGLEKLRSGSYHVLLLGGAPGTQGRIVLAGRHEQTTLSFVAGGLRTVAKVEVAFY